MLPLRGRDQRNPDEQVHFLSIDDTGVVVEIGFAVSVKMFVFVGFLSSIQTLVDGFHFVRPNRNNEY